MNQEVDYGNSDIRKPRRKVYLATPQVDPEDPLIEGFSLSNLTKVIDACKSTRVTY